MGSVIGSVIGAGASLIGGQQSAKAAKQSAMIQAAAQDRAGERALTGYKYLTEGEGAAPMRGYIDAGQRALGNQGTTQNLMMDLLGITGYGNATRPAPAAGGGGGEAPAAGGGGNALTGYMGLGGPNSGQGATGGAFVQADPNAPPYPVWHQQTSGMYAPGVPMAAPGQPANSYNYAPGNNALNNYSVPSGGWTQNDGYGGVAFSGIPRQPGAPIAPTQYSGA